MVFDIKVVIFSKIIKLLSVSSVQAIYIIYIYMNIHLNVRFDHISLHVYVNLSAVDRCYQKKKAASTLSCHKSHNVGLIFGP
jgi:hypothetical protein